MPLRVLQSDITQIPVDAIVNAANRHLLMGSGVCGAIFHSAGIFRLQLECLKIGHCEVGEAVITKGYSLPCKYIVHTVGPVWHGGFSGESNFLHKCYANSISLARAQGCKSISFPLISTGNYGYPPEQALVNAIFAIQRSLSLDDIETFLVLRDKSLVELSKKLIKNAEQRS